MKLLNRMKSWETFKELTKRTKQKVASNCFMLPKEIKWYIAEKRMYYVTMDAGVVILCDEGSFFHLYYYVQSAIPLEMIKTDKPIVINFVEHDSRIDPGVSEMKRNWRRLGFRPYTTTQRMLRANIETDIPTAQLALDKINKHGLSVKLAQKNDVDQVMNIWHCSLDDLLHPLFDRKHILEQIEKKQVICVCNDQRDVLGALQYEQAGNSLMLCYVAVDVQLRNMGGGRAMVYKMIEIARGKGARNTSVWVVNDNHGAIRFYNKIGYKFDGMQSQRYLLCCDAQ